MLTITIKIILIILFLLPVFFGLFLDIPTILLSIYLLILPLIYKIFFWTYTLQLKEYRFDRFREYIRTTQGKNAIFNFWFPTELTVFISTFIVFFDSNVWLIIDPIIFFFLFLENIFVIGKILRKNVLTPVFTARTKLLLSIIFIGIVADFYFIFNYYTEIIYTYIMGILLFPYMVIFICNLLLLPLVNYQKKKLINRAIEKSNKINNPIKIGITGSYGKSSVKEFLSSVLENEGKLLKTPENINSELGVSGVVINKLDNSYDYFVAEMGAYRIGEIELLGEIVNHKYGFLTAIGNQHLGLFGGIENTKTAKFEIAKKVLENGGNLYINYDDKNIQTVNLKAGLSIIKYGMDSDNLDAKSTITDYLDGKTSFDFTYKGKTHNFTTNLIGKHNILNITGVIAFCIDLGIKTENIETYLLSIKTPKHTLEVSKKEIETDDKKIELILIDDSYNLSQEGLLAGIDVLKHYPNHEKILILDDILELGYKSREIHTDIGKSIAKNKLIDKIMLVGINYKKDFIKGLKNGGFDENNIINKLGNFNKNTVILFEGRGTRKILERI